MENTNLVLSEEERRVVQDASFILTKNRIIQKVYGMFGELANEDRNRWDLLPPPITGMAPKISRGENVSGLPWVMLDYPRYFTETDVLAIRIFFWWGNYFSITLHLKGKFQKVLSEGIMSSLPKLKEQAWSVGVGEDPWDHDHHKGIYRPLMEMDSSAIKVLLENKDSFRLSKKYSLDNWLEAYRNLQNDRNILQTILLDGLKIS
ncbi:MAG: hypothetical protein ACO29O_04190 [Chitinophagaceae bacterium]